MNDQVKTQETEKVEKPKVEIIRGRMPLPLVRLIKFAHSDLNDSQVADMYRTTSGKVSDVRKNRNFGYIAEDTTAFSQEQIDGAKARIEQFTSDDQDIVNEAMSDAGIRVATEEEQAAFDEQRAGSRKPRGKKEEAAETAEADAEVADETPTEATADVPAEEDDDGLGDLLG